MAITGASGAIYGIKLVQQLAGLNYEVELTISEPASQIINHELGMKINLEKFDPACFCQKGALRYYHYTDLMAPISSGSYRTLGMVVSPCSMATLGGIASGTSRNLIERAADVHLKERRPLILVLRETPFNAVHIANMLKAAEAGAIIMPAAPSFYHKPKSVEELVDFFLVRVLDQLGIESSDKGRWGRTETTNSHE